MLLNWRKKRCIQKNSLTKVEHGIKNQLIWLKNCHIRKDYHHWFVKFKNKKIGWICITEPNINKKHIRWGYYVGIGKYAYLGGIIPCYLYNYIFFELNYKITLSETLTSNIKVDEILKFHGFTRANIIRNYTIKNGYNIDRYNLKLTIEKWLKKKEFHKLKYDFKLPKNKEILYKLKNNNT